MALITFVFVYVFGGLTFVPLLLAAVLVPAWYWLPQKDSATTSTTQDEIGASEEPKVSSSSSDAAASGTFAVLRSYNLPVANAALNSRNNSNNGNGGGGAEGDAEASVGSESVYQSMYRSVFDRGKSVAASGSVLEKDDDRIGTSPKTKKNAVPVNVFHIVLRHGHLMLYDSTAQLEVRHVISMATHTISLSQGPLPEDDIGVLKDGELFIKRTAIVLTPIEYPNGQLQSRAAASKPFFLFSNTCSDNEDFYHALLYTKSSPPVPIPLDPNDAIKLQSTLHSTSLTPETRALNALTGRIFLALYRTDRLKDILQKKVEKKISRVQKPAFIASLDVHSVDFGDAAPVISNLKLKELNIDGDMTVSLDVRYDGGVKSVDGLQKRSGGIKLTISALAKLDLGPRFKTRTVDLLLATSLQRLSGRMLLRIKPPPSNRIWFCFESMPEMDIKVEPVVSSRQITYTFVLRAIEERIRSVVGETLVKPNWDDVPFFDTRGQKVRGGIWNDEGSDDSSTVEQPTLDQKSPRTMSMPPLVGEGESSGASSGSEAAARLASGSTLAATGSKSDLKRRSVASLPLKSQTTALDMESVAPASSQTFRSPSFAKVAPSAASVAVDDANAEQIRSQETGNQPARLWRSKPPTLLKKEAMDAMREMRDRSQNYHRREGNVSGTAADGSGDHAEANDLALEQTDEYVSETISRRSSDPSSPISRSSTGLAAGTLRSPTRIGSRLSAESGSSTASSTQQQRKTILAATAAATTAARNWSWNAIQNARASKTTGSSHVRQGSAGPMGRGQPLPPPGVPLPGPQKSSMFVGLGGNSLKRKPVSQAHAGSSDLDQTNESEKRHSQGVIEDSGTLHAEPQDMVEAPTVTAVETEFGPWRENSGDYWSEGLDDELNHAPSRNESHTHIDDLRTTESSKPDSSVEGIKKVPPPLPTRPTNYVTPVTDIVASSGKSSMVHTPSVKLSSPTGRPHQKDQALLKQAVAGSSQTLEGKAAHFINTEDEAVHRHNELPHDRLNHTRHTSTASSLHSVDDDAVVAIPAPIEDDAEAYVPEQSSSVFHNEQNE